MSKKRHPNSIGIRHNPTSGLYEISERGITYAMPMELTTPLKAYFRYYVNNHDDRTVAEWYKRLEKEDKRKVERSGEVPEEDNGFQADVPHWDE